MSLDLSSARTNPVRLVWLCVAGKWDSVKSAGFVLRNETIPGLSQAFPRSYLREPLAAGLQWLLPNFAPMPPRMSWPLPKALGRCSCWEQGRATTSWAQFPSPASSGSTEPWNGLGWKGP